MKEFKYVITDEVGIHARPAGLLVQEAKKFTSTIMFIKGEKSAKATSLMKLMGMGIVKGDEVTIQVDGEDEDDTEWQYRIFGCPGEEAVKGDYEIPEHAEGFPPCALFATAGDDLVNPEHSKMLARVLEGMNIPCRLEIGPEGGHGFADGSGMCMAGWTERAVKWFESLQK